MMKTRKFRIENEGRIYNCQITENVIKNNNKGNAFIKTVCKVDDINEVNVIELKKVNNRILAMEYKLHDAIENWKLNTTIYVVTPNDNVDCLVDIFVKEYIKSSEKMEGTLNYPSLKCAGANAMEIIFKDCKFVSSLEEAEIA